MSCDISTFPFEEKCKVLQDNYSTTEDKYVLHTFSGVKAISNKTVNITMFLNESEMEEFSSWYYCNASNLQEFLITLILFGVKKMYKAVIVNELNESNFKGKYREIKLSLLIDEEWQPSTIDCDDNIECEDLHPVCEENYKGV